MTIKITPRTIDASDAKLLLEYEMENNRQPSKSAVDTLAADMLHGKWLENGDTIKVLENGTLVDGGHRLRALIRAQEIQNTVDPSKTVRIDVLIAEGVDPHSVLVIDTGRIRSIRDQIRMLGGVSYNNKVAAMVGWYWRYRRGNKIGSRGTGALQPSRSQVLDLWQSDVPGFEASYKRGVDVWHQQMGRATPAALAHYLFSKVDHEQAEVFFDYFVSGENLKFGDPILALRRRLVVKTSVHKTTDAENLALIILTWNRVIEGRPMEKIQLPRIALNNTAFPAILDPATKKPVEEEVLAYVSTLAQG